MKFGKNIRREMLNNRNLHYLNYKYLKKLIKYIHIKSNANELEEAFDLNREFENVLHGDLSIIEETFRRMFNEMIGIQGEIEKNFKTELVADVKKIEKNISFDELLNILKEKNVSKEFFDFCIQLSMLSNKCKILRTYVIYNYIGLIKILKKKRKHCDRMFETLLVSDVVHMYSWCLSEELPKLISSVNIICDEFMQNFVEGIVTVEKYSCPICLHLINEPVVLSSCFHSFCWNCLATAIQKYSMDCCPICRTKIFYDKNSIQVDGILCRFLNKYFLNIEGGSVNNSVLFEETPSVSFSPKLLREGDASFKEEKYNKNTDKSKNFKLEEKDHHHCDCLSECERSSSNVAFELVDMDHWDSHRKNNKFEKVPMDNEYINIKRNNKIKENRNNTEEFYIMNMERENGVFRYESGNIEENSLDNLNEYLSVLNKNDSNSIEDKEKESDYSDDSRGEEEGHYNSEQKKKNTNDLHTIGNFQGMNELQHVFTYSSDKITTNSEVKNENNNDNYNIINKVISYTLN